MTEPAPVDWTKSSEAKYLVSTILNRYHKTRLRYTDLHEWVLGDPLVCEALTAVRGAPTAQPSPSERGYSVAFYELAELLGIPARPVPPQDVWECELLPRIKALLQTEATAQKPDPQPQPDYRAMLAATARYITHDRECATVVRHGGHLCSCGASAAARDAHAAMAPLPDPDPTGFFQPRPVR